jgi:hypothetical protein
MMLVTSMYAIPTIPPKKRSQEPLLRFVEGQLNSARAGPPI